MYLVQHEIQIHVYTKNCKSTNLLSASQNEMSNFVVQTHLAQLYKKFIVQKTCIVHIGMTRALSTKFIFMAL